MQMQQLGLPGASLVASAGSPASAPRPGGFGAPEVLEISRRVPVAAPMPAPPSPLPGWLLPPTPWEAADPLTTRRTTL